jgi:hypothetical protein
MSVESIGAVGSSPSVGGAGAIGGAKASPSNNTGGSAPTAAPTKPSGNGGQVDMCKNMSTSNFISLTEQVNGASSSGMPDAEKMIQAVLALELLEKVVEAVGQVLENILNPGK